MNKELREILKPWGQACYTGYVDPANVISAILKLFKQEMLRLIGEDIEYEDAPLDTSIKTYDENGIVLRKYYWEKNRIDGYNQALAELHNAINTEGE
jgi:hypothetical protein